MLIQRMAEIYNLKYLRSGLYYEMVENKKGKLRPIMKLKMYTCQLSVWILIVITVRHFNNRQNSY
jgi:hypothetical protein